MTGIFATNEKVILLTFLAVVIILDLSEGRPTNDKGKDEEQEGFCKQVLETDKTVTPEPKKRFYTGPVKSFKWLYKKLPNFLKNWIKALFKWLGNPVRNQKSRVILWCVFIVIGIFCGMTGILSWLGGPCVVCGVCGLCCELWAWCTSTPTTSYSSTTYGYSDPYYYNRPYYGGGGGNVEIICCCEIDANDCDCGDIDCGDGDC